MNETELYPQRRMTRNIWLVLAILITGLIITAITSFYVKKDVEVDARHEFDSSCNEIRLKIEARLQAHARILRSGAAFFDASNDVTREEWHTFTLRQRVEQQLSGIQGIGFSLVIPPERLAQHEQEIRSQGFSQYHVRPEGKRDIYTSIIYLEPFEGRNLRAFGYDMFSEPVRRAAMELARDTDSPALSGKVILVQETEKDVQAGTLMYVPVYRKGVPTDTVEQRRAAIYGWSYSPYRMNDLMQGILGEWDKHKGIHLRIFDGELLSPDTLLYDSQAISDGKQVKETVSGYESPLTRHTPPALNTRIVSAGRIWTLSVRTDGQALSHDSIRVWLVILGGIITSILLAMLAFSLLNTNFKAQQLAEQLTFALSQSEVRYRHLSNLTFEGIFFHIDGIIIDCNQSFASLTGYSREELLGKDSVELLIPENYRPVIRQNISSKISAPYEADLLIKNNILIPVEIQGRNIVLNNREMRVAAVRDISIRRKAETELRESEEKYRIIFNNEIYAICIFDLQTLQLLDVNDTYTKTYGYSREELLSGMTVHDITAEHQVSDAATTKAVLEGTIFIPLRYHRKKDGTVFPIEIVGGPYTWQGRKVMFALAHDITERQQAEKELKEFNCRLEALSITDGLTGIANRRHFDEVLDREHARHLRSGAQLSMILMDIDHFKAFNDNYGHVKGDECLRLIGRVLAQSANRPADLAARYGGEEFACILPETDNRGAIIVAEKIHRNIQNLAIPHKGSSAAECVTASLGVITLKCTECTSADAIIARADTLLYRAKSSGRNRIEFDNTQDII